MSTRYCDMLAFRARAKMILGHALHVAVPECILMPCTCIRSESVQINYGYIANIYLACMAASFSSTIFSTIFCKIAGAPLVPLSK